MTNLEHRVEILERGLRMLLRFLDGQHFGPLPIAHDRELLLLFRNIEIPEGKGGTGGVSQ